MAGNSLPVQLPQTLLWKLRNFPDEVYSFGPNDNLTRFMSILLGDSGVGQLNSIQTASLSLEQFPYYSDLDQILGVLLSSLRLPSEIYSSSVDPFTDQLSVSLWQEVNSKDSSYRERLISTAAALLKGATPLGVQSLAESTSQVKFQVVENWTPSANTVTSGNGWSRNLGSSEVVFIPLVPPGLSFNEETLYSTVQSLYKLQPAGVEFTVYSGSVNPYSSINYTVLSGSSNFFYFDRNDTANNINIPSYVVGNSDPTVANRYWLRNGVTSSAPYFAFGQTQEQIIDLTNNISMVDVSNSFNPNEESTKNMLGIPSMPINNTALGG